MPTKKKLEYTEIEASSELTTEQQESSERSSTLLLEIMRESYYKEMERTNILDNKTGVFISALIAVITIFMPIIPFDNLITLYKDGAKYQIVGVTCALCGLVVEALHFLVKPISDSEFKNVFDRALHKYNTINSTISLKWQNERYNIKIAEIKYIEGYKRHVTVYTKSESFEALGKITEILKELEPHGFVRTHQGFIVNMDFIKRFDSNDVILFDDSKIMLSVRMRRDALQKFDNYIKRKKW